MENPLSKKQKEALKNLAKLYEESKETITDESTKVFIENIKEFKVHIDLMILINRKIQYNEKIINEVHHKNNRKYIATHISAAQFIVDVEKVKEANERLEKMPEIQKKITAELIKDLERLKGDILVQLRYKKMDSTFPLLLDDGKQMRKFYNNWREWILKHLKTENFTPENTLRYCKRQYNKIKVELANNISKLGYMYDVKSYIKLYYPDMEEYLL